MQLQLPTHQLNLSVLLLFLKQNYEDGQLKYYQLYAENQNSLSILSNIVKDQRRNLPVTVTVEQSPSG